MNRTRILPFVVLIVFLTGCKKQEDNRCFKPTGEIVTEIRPLDAFTHLSLHDKFNVFIVTDTLNFLKIEAGANMMSFITSDIQDDTLKIRNENQCNWLRSYNDPINLYVSSNTLRRIFIYGYCDLKTVNTFEANYLYVEAASPISTAVLDVNVRVFYFQAVYTTGDFILSGVTDSLRIFNIGTGYVFAQNLASKRCWVLNQSTGDSHVNVSGRLHVEIHESGNVYYYREPELINIIEISSSGQLLPR